MTAPKLPKNPFPNMRALSALVRAGDERAVNYVVRVLKRTKGNRSKAAESLGIAESLLYDWLATDALRDLVPPSPHRPYAGTATDDNGKPIPIAELARRLGISRAAYYKRLKAGKSGAELAAPPRAGSSED